MSLTLHFHPLSSFCQKVLVALYESETPFTPHLVDLSDPAANAALKALWPIGKFPVLRDEARDRTIPETSVIVEYLAQHYPGAARLIPSEPDLAVKTRLQDRFFDLYVNTTMQKVITDRLRPAGQNDSYGVEDARRMLRTALDMIEKDMASNVWAIGDRFTMADCAAAPALFYADMVIPLADKHPRTAAYLDRLKKRPSFSRTLEEAKPYLRFVPKAGD